MLTLVTTVGQGLRFPTSDSNALVVDAAHTTSGHPLAVFGPQVAYWAPELLVQEVIEAPGIAADGVSFPGTGLVELGPRLRPRRHSRTARQRGHTRPPVAPVASVAGGAATCLPSGA